MEYYFSAIVETPFEEAVARVTEELAREGFEVLSDIDIKEALKKKLGKDFRRYRILGACNPALSYQALQADDNIGVLLPCSVVVQEHAEGRVEVSCVDPVATMQSTGNPSVMEVAKEARRKLMAAIDLL